MGHVRSPKLKGIVVNIVVLKSALSKEWFFKLYVKTECLEEEILEQFTIYTKSLSNIENIKKVGVVEVELMGEGLMVKLKRG
jgi:hypothetical protein